MITAEDLTARLATFLGQEIVSTTRGARITLLTPAEYPDCEAVAVHVESDQDGGYVISDLAAADSLLVGYLNPKKTATKAGIIADRFDVTFESGSVIARVNAEETLPEACWRVALASAAIAEGVDFTSGQQTPGATFEDVITTVLRQRDVYFQRDLAVEGLSGHRHTASVFVPASEAVIEPITGRKAWDRATRVYAEFGDLAQLNGYRLIAVLDDRTADLRQEAKLLSQVGQVGVWSRHDEWLEAVVREP